MDQNHTFAKSKAVALRKRGLSYNEIRKQTGRSKSTLSFWLKGIKLNFRQRKRLYTKQIEILSRGSQSQKERRAREVEAIIKKAEDEITFPMSFESVRLIGAALYWAEGSKEKLMKITNSDPHLILFMVRWTESMFKIPAKDLKARLNIYPQQNEQKIKKFWSEITGIPLKNFGKSYIKPFSRGYKKNNLYYGTIRIEVAKSVNFKHQIFGWIKGLLKDININVELKQKQWKSHIEIERPVNLH